LQLLYVDEAEEIHLQRRFLSEREAPKRTPDDHQFLNILQQCNTVVPDYNPNIQTLVANVPNDPLHFATPNSELLTPQRARSIIFVQYW